MVKLKPCPFCGAIPKCTYIEKSDKWFIMCESSKCRIQPMTDFHKNKGVIVKEWNRRAKDGKL